MSDRFAYCVLAIAVACTGLAPIANAQRAASGNPAARAVAEALPAQLEAIHAELATTENIHDQFVKAKVIFDHTLAYAEASDARLFVEAAYTFRLLTHLVETDPAVRERILPHLLEDDILTRELAFMINQHDEIAKAYAMLDRLLGADAEAVHANPALAAALCVVHDAPVTWQLNENSVTAADPVALFAYLALSDRRKAIDAGSLPPELLVYVVDSPAPVSEMEWALSKHSRDRQVGRRFHDITYDTGHYKYGRAKRVNKAGYCLQNIRKHGGICIDQAYYAAIVGKSLGVPTAIATARSGEEGHAWIGYLQLRGNRTFWDFDQGRYEEYEGLRGNIKDPQSGMLLADSKVNLLSRLASVSRETRLTAAAYTDASTRLAQWSLAPKGWPSLNAPNVATVREPTIEAAISLAKLAINTCPAYLPAWEHVGFLAEKDMMTPAQMKEFADVTMDIFSKESPDFVVDIIGPMAHAIDDPNGQHEVWESLYEITRRRPDLAAEIRMSQGALWAEHGNPERAWEAYDDVVRRYLNDGAFAIAAVDACVQILNDQGKPGRAAGYLRTAWQRSRRPRGGHLVGSNWYQLANRYMQQLQQNGDTNEAEKVRRQVEAMMR